MRAMSRSFLVSCLSSCLVVLAVLALPTSASAKTRHPRTPTAAVSAPPAGGDALILWCRHAVFTKYGNTGIAAPGMLPGVKYRVMLEDTASTMISYCVQQGGKNY